VNNRQRVALALTCWAVAGLIVRVDWPPWRAMGSLVVGRGSWMTATGDIAVAMLLIGAGLTVLLGWSRGD
jgi:hypothetical protein